MLAKSLNLNYSCPGHRPDHRACSSTGLSQGRECILSRSMSCMFLHYRVSHGLKRKAVLSSRDRKHTGASLALLLRARQVGERDRTRELESAGRSGCRRNAMIASLASAIGGNMFLWLRLRNGQCEEGCERKAHCWREVDHRRVGDAGAAGLLLL